MAQDTPLVDFDLANDFNTAPLMGSPQYGFLNIVGTPTDELVDRDIYALGFIPRGVEDSIFVGGRLREMDIELVSRDENGVTEVVQRIEAGTQERAVEVEISGRDEELFLVITDVPSGDRGIDTYDAEPYVITFSTSLALTQGARALAGSLELAGLGESGTSGSFLLELLERASIDTSELTDGGSDEPLPVASNEDDVLVGRLASDEIVALRGDDEVRGLLGDDVITGDRGADILYGNQGRDTLYGGRDDDVAYGGKDRDMVFGGEGADVLYGNLGTDALYGGALSDTLYGGRGSDFLYGGPGDDILFGNRGSDGLYGGDGSDLFVINGEAETSVIFDFKPLDGDRIVVAGGLKYAPSIDGTLVQQIDTGAQVILVGVYEFSEDYVLSVSI
ncbi:MAG: hypothetical protein KI792_01430 [Alphaproteobacteria bacterium]|nr:hypothetical protein [Alphaproteobacteria bacterium SS10]